MTPCSTAIAVLVGDTACTQISNLSNTSVTTTTYNPSKYNVTPSRICINASGY